MTTLLACWCSSNLLNAETTSVRAPGKIDHAVRYIGPGGSSAASKKRYADFSCPVTKAFKFVLPSSVHDVACSSPKHQHHLKLASRQYTYLLKAHPEHELKTNTMWTDDDIDFVCILLATVLAALFFDGVLQRQKVFGFKEPTRKKKVSKMKAPKMKIPKPDVQKDLGVEFEVPDEIYD